MAVTDITKPTTRYEKYSSNLNRAGDAARPTNFQKDVTQTTGFDPATGTPGQQSPWDGRDLIPEDFPETAEYYKIQGGYIQTSAPEMFVKLHYYAMPVDEEGYPMIPDVTEYKEALYWYVLSKMIGAGYKHPVIPADVRGMEYAYEKYEFHAGRALGRIMLPSQDKMARLRDGFAQRMVPPQHFYDDFGVGGEQIQANRYI